MGPPTAQRDGSSTGQRCYSWSSILPEAASTSDSAHRPSSAYQLVPSAALCAEEGTHPGGTVPDLEQILVQSIRAGDDFIIAVRGEGPSEGPDTSGEHPTTDAETALLCSRADGIPRGALIRATVG